MLMEYNNAQELMVSKILTVGDSHGCRNPLIIARQNLNNFDKIIFLGDFFDHDDGSFEEQKKIFTEVMQLKHAYPEKIIVLLGNHDANYILPEMAKWQPEHETEIQNLILKNINKIDLTYLEKCWLFSHAGVSEVWFYNQLIADGYSSEPALLLKNKFNKTYSDNFNNRIHSKDFSILKFCGTSGYGDEITQNPMWIRPDSLMLSALPDFNQVVGHSAVEPEDRIQIKNVNTILFLDSYPHQRNIYAEIDTDTNHFAIKKFE